MPPVKQSPRFRDWLDGAVTDSGLSKRAIARQMAAKHPRGVTADTIETYRRTINKILAGNLTPTQPTRDAICDVLGRDDAPTVDDDDDEESDLDATLVALARQQADLTRQLNRLLKARG